jgi:hypothetical protein
VRSIERGIIQNSISSVAAATAEGAWDNIRRQGQSRDTAHPQSNSNRGSSSAFRGIVALKIASMRGNTKSAGSSEMASSLEIFFKITPNSIVV